MQEVSAFGLLASAVAGRTLEVLPADATWCDGVTVHLAPGESALARATVQAALAGSGSLDPDVLARLGRRQAVADRYLAVEGHRALAGLRSFLPLSVACLCDADVARLSGSPAESADVARGSAPLPAPLPEFGELRPGQVRLPAKPAESAGSAGLVEDRALEAGEAEPELPQAAPGDDLSSPVGGSGVLGRLLGSLLGEQASASSSGPIGAGSRARRSRRTPRRGLATVAGAPGGWAVDAPPGEARSYRYPEWDCHRGTYREGWCTVADRPAPEGEPLDLPVVATELRRRLAPIGLDRRSVTRQRSGADIDVDALVRHHVDLRSGHTPDEAVYVDTAKVRRDLAVLVLLDVSGSAGEPARTGGTVHDQQRALGAGLATALGDLGARVAVYAFRSTGRGSVNLLALKAFGDHSAVPLQRRLGALQPGAYTRLGAAVRHGTHLLADGGAARRRALVVVSDGLAYDHGYDGEYGEADAHHALAEARRTGIGCVCLSVGSATDAQALQRIFGSAAHASLGEPADAAAVVTRLFAGALAAAEGQRKPWAAAR